ncbi:PREDICTED: paired box protein Pax-6-like [Amphimedon queenslandica]|nr:PREDICTED: paired box protein Pax-6-like [Amphimedon queenslandica]|eukprot:XP_003389232.1 PREDICTED: paired box protein Pax-6-like [Amphimedon queenslandica]
MEQTGEALSDEGPKVAPINTNSYSSDFSVSTRLLQADNPTQGASSSYIAPTYPTDNYSSNPPPPPNGWQFLLPSDMGTARGHPHSTGQYEPAPNASLSLMPPPPYQSIAYCNGYPGSKIGISSLPSQSLDVHGHHHTSIPPLHHKFDIGYNSWNVGASSSTGSGSNSGKPLPPVGTLTSPPSVSYPSSPSYNDQDNPDSSRPPMAIKEESYIESDDRGEEDYGPSDEESDSNSTTDKDAEPKKPKRTRTAYSNSQLDQLELIFATTHYPDVFTREDLSRRLGIREDRIQVWFQNRRARFRKQERTGSISCRSRYRQKRLEKLQHNFMPSSAGYPPTHYPPSVVGGGNTLSLVSSPSVSTTSPVSYDFSQSQGFSFQTSFYPVTPNYRSYSTGTAFQYPGGLASLFQTAPSTAEGK